MFRVSTVLFFLVAIFSSSFIHSPTANASEPGNVISSDPSGYLDWVLTHLELGDGEGDEAERGVWGAEEPRCGSEENGRGVWGAEEPRCGSEDNERGVWGAEEP